MTITYRNGKIRDVFILSDRDGCMRVAVEGSEDIERFMIAGDHTWLSEEGEMVRVKYAWEHQPSMPAVSEADCICPTGLASTLVEWLYDESDLEKELEVETAKTLTFGAYT